MWTPAGPVSPATLALWATLGTLLQWTDASAYATLVARAGGAGGNPIISGASPRRRCPPPPAWAAGFGFLASNRGITDNPGTTCMHAGHLRDLTTHISHPGGKAILAGHGLLAAGRSQPGRAGPGGRPGRFPSALSSLPSCHIPQAPRAGLGTATSALEATRDTLQELGAGGCAGEAHLAPAG